MASDPVKHLKLWRAIVAYPMNREEKDVLQCLCSFGNSDGTKCWPSQRTLAELNEMSLRDMRRVFKAMREHKFIIEDGWVHRCKQWRINTELFLTALPKKEKKPATPKKAKPAPEKPKPVVPPVAAPPVVEGPPPLTPEQIAKRHADKEKVLEKLRR